MHTVGRWRESKSAGTLRTAYSAGNWPGSLPGDERSAGPTCCQPPRQCRAPGTAVSGRWILVEPPSFWSAACSASQASVAICSAVSDTPRIKTIRHSLPKAAAGSSPAVADVSVVNDRHPPLRRSGRIRPVPAGGAAAFRVALGAHPTARSLQLYCGHLQSRQAAGRLPVQGRATGLAPSVASTALRITDGVSVGAGQSRRIPLKTGRNTT